MRVLLNATVKRPWNSGRYVYQALRDLGHQVKIFDYRVSRNINHELIESADTFKPDLMLTLKGERIEPELVKRVIDKGIYTVLWYPDPHREIPRWLCKLARTNNFFFTILKGMISKFRERGIEKVEWLSQGFAPSFYHCNGINEKEMRKYGSDVTLIGAIDYRAIYKKRYYMLMRVMEEGIRVKWWGPRISLEFRNIPIIFSRLVLRYGGKFIYNEEYAKVVQSSKIFLAADAYPEIEGSVSARIYTATGCGAFYLSEYVKGIEEIFEIDKEIIVFRNPEEMIEKIRYYLDRQEERQGIAKAAQEKVLSKYTYVHRLSEMFSVLKERDGLG
ncbi:MAG: glycosyltransferase [Deltaproteobacteria bacterium]|nr:MAG: glycosyltransferase [Deltaproteobacteria bacterium]